MKTFLDTVAFDLFRRTSGHMENVTIIFPNKRASLFMDQSISRLTKRPVWSPRYTTISELFQSMTTLTVADPIMLNCLLYEVYHRVSGTNETFDHFYSWGDVLISDFDDIDSNMVNAEMLFANVADIEAMTSFSYLSDEQVKAIRQFFNTFNVDQKTDLHERFLKMWNIMPRLYKEYHALLEKEGLAYEGMLKRKVIEGNYTDSLKTDTIYAIVGFNALSETERRLFLHLKNNCNALFYWDYDEDIDTEESGDCLRENIHLFGEAMPPQQSQDTASDGPDSVLIASSTDNAQCRFAGDWLKDTIKAEAPQNRTAIVLCDESLLLPVLHSIPPMAADGTPVQLNITMGYPMQDMPVSSFILAMLTMQVKGWRDERTLFYRYVNQVLQHPLVQRLDPDGVKTIMSEMLKYNIVYPHTNKFADSDALSRIFIRKTDTIDILSHLKDCLELIARNIGTDISSTGTMNSNGNDPLTAESLFAAWTMVNRLLTIAQTGRLPLQRGDTLIRLMRHIISQRAIPFHGEPACGVQLMGVLETRNLDFDNIIMLSVGEGIMPRPSHQSSFVPYTLRQAYGMTTTELGDGIYAYYFNRLRHRASHVTYVFNNSTEGLHKGEMSRFLINMKLSGIEIKNLRPASDKVFSQSIPSIDEGRTSEDEQTAPCAEQKGADDTQAHSVSLSFSPSALNTYIVCPLKYYLTYPCGLREPDEVSEEIDDACFGSIFHRAMELIYKDFVGKGDIQASQIASIRGNKVALEKLVTQAFTDITQNKDTHFTGEQRLNHDVITHFVEKQLELDEQLCPMAILGLERPIELPYGGKGIIDREDIVTIEGSRRHRIVDYKTSAHPNTASSIEALFTQSDKHADHIFQALYYCEVVTSQNPDGVTRDTLSPALDYVKPYHPGDDMTIRISSEPVTDYHAQCHKEFRQRLDSLIAEIRSDQNQFGPTPSKSCEYCPFITICPSPASN